MPSSVRDVYLAYLLRQWEGSSCIVFTSTCKVRAHRASLHVARHAASTWQNVAMRRPRGRRASSSRQRSLRSASNARRSTHNSRRCSDTMAFLSRPAMALLCAGAARSGLLRRCLDLPPNAGASACGGEQAQAGVTPNLDPITTKLGLITTKLGLITTMAGHVEADRRDRRRRERPRHTSS